MPTVPRLSDNRVQQAGLPGVRVSTNAPIEAFGGGTERLSNAMDEYGRRVNAGIEAVVNPLAKLAQEHIEKANQQAVDGARADTVILRNNLIFDPITGASLRKGLGAAGISEEYSAQFDKGADEIAKRLTPAQQEAYSKIRLAERTDLFTSLEKYTFSELEGHKKTVLEKITTVSAEDAALNAADWKNPDPLTNPIEKNKSLARGAINRFYADRQGPDGDESLNAMAAVKESETNIHMGVLDQIVSRGDYKTAQEYFAKYKEEIHDPGKRADIVKKLDTMSRLGNAQENADRIWTQAGGDLASSYELAGKIEDPEVRASTERMIVERSNIMRNAYEMGQKNALSQGLGLVQKGIHPKDHPAAIQSKYSPEVTQKLEDRWKSDKEDKTRESSAATYEWFMKGLQNPATREKFMKKDIALELGGKLLDSDQKSLVNEQLDARNGKSTDKLDNGFTVNQNILKRAAALGINEESSLARVELETQERLKPYRKRGELITDVVVNEVTTRTIREGLKAGWIKKKIEKQPDLDGFRTNKDIVNSILKAQGIDDQDQIESFNSQVDREVIALQQAKQRKVTNEEIEAIAKNLAVKGKTPGFLWKKTKFAFEAEPGEDFKIEDIKQIPIVEKNAIVEAMKRRQEKQRKANVPITPITDEEVLDLYTKKVRGSRGN